MANKKKKQQDGQKKKLSPKVQVVLVVLGVLVFGFLGNKLLVGPQNAKAKELDGQIAATQQQIAAVTASIGAGASSAAPLKTADLFRLTKAMPDSDDMSGMMLELNGVARDTGVTFDSISWRGLTAQTGYTKVTIDLAFRGNFYALSDFLYRLRNLVGVHNGKLEATGRLYTVDQLNFALSGPAGRISEIRATLGVSAYTFGAAGAPGAAATPATTTDGTTTTATTPATTTPATTTPATTTTTPSPSTPPAPPAGATAAPVTQ